MNFCEKCGNLLIAEKRSGKSGLYCRKCNKFFKAKGVKSTIISEKIEQEDETIKVFNEDDDYKQYPKAKDVICEKCGNNEAYWFLQQTRGGDEPQTKFYCCSKCKHKWREY
ncbi:MAG: transcription factor S [Candidatus Aenigmarchaeota archaeon]|nr:transcription factor S [Candidatus Aenigmarchaeota archaeon]